MMLKPALRPPMRAPMREALAPGEGVGGWSPAILGASLYDMWDAEQASTFTLVGTAVSSWRSTKNASDAVQAVGAARPIYSATSFNSRPGVTLDGADDELAFLGVGVLPTGATEVDIWGLVDQQALAADTAGRWAFAYGGTTTATVRTIGRGVPAGVVRGEGYGNNSGSASSNTSVEFIGRHVVRNKIRTADITTDVDGIAGPAVAGTPAGGTTRTRIGGSTNSSPVALWKGVISLIAVTAPLTGADEAQMLAYLKTRGGIA